MKPAVFGGSFDPPHLGHHHIISCYREFYPDSRIILVPCGQNPLKEKGHYFSDTQRLKLLGLLFSDLKDVFVEDFELKHAGNSYTIDTLRYLQEKYQPAEKMHFIIGDDLARQISFWKHQDHLRELAEFICFTREGTDQTVPGVTYHQVEPFEASSTEVRSLLLNDNHEELKKYLTAEQLDYISKLD